MSAASIASILQAKIDSLSPFLYTNVMSTVINVHDFKTHYSKYLEQVQAGQEVILGKHGKAIAKLVPLPQEPEPRKLGALKGKIQVRDGYDMDEPMLELWDILAKKEIN